MYIYIYRERERCVCIYIYIYICIGRFQKVHQEAQLLRAERMGFESDLHWMQTGVNPKPYTLHPTPCTQHVHQEVQLLR